MKNQTNGRVGQKLGIGTRFACLPGISNGSITSIVWRISRSSMAHKSDKCGLNVWLSILCFRPILQMRLPFRLGRNPGILPDAETSASYDSTSRARFFEIDFNNWENSLECGELNLYSMTCRQQSLQIQWRLSGALESGISDKKRI